MTCPLTLTIPPPHPDWAARAPLAVNSLPGLCVWGGGEGDQLVTPGGGGGGGAGRSYTHPIVSRLGRAQVSSTPFSAFLLSM